jgi:hypothetical protein
LDIRLNNMTIENIDFIEKYTKKIRQLTLISGDNQSIFLHMMLDHEAIFYHLIKNFPNMISTNKSFSSAESLDIHFLTNLDKYFKDEENRTNFKSYNQELYGLVAAYLHYYSYLYKSSQYPNVFKLFHESIFLYRNKITCAANITPNTSSSSYTSDKHYPLLNKINLAFDVNYYPKKSGEELIIFLLEVKEYLTEISLTPEIQTKFRKSNEIKILLSGMINILASHPYKAHIDAVLDVLDNLTYKIDEVDVIHRIIDILFNLSKTILSDNFQDKEFLLNITKHVIKCSAFLEESNMTHPKLEQIKKQLKPYIESLLAYPATHRDIVNFDSNIKSKIVKELVEKINLTVFCNYVLPVLKHMTVYSHETEIIHTMLLIMYNKNTDIAIRAIQSLQQIDLPPEALKKVIERIIALNFFAKDTDVVEAALNFISSPKVSPTQQQDIFYAMIEHKKINYINRLSLSDKFIENIFERYSNELSTLLKNTKNDYTNCEKISDIINIFYYLQIPNNSVIPRMKMIKFFNEIYPKLETFSYNNSNTLIIKIITNLILEYYHMGKIDPADKEIFDGIAKTLLFSSKKLTDTYLETICENLFEIAGYCNDFNARQYFINALLKNINNGWHRDEMIKHFSSLKEKMTKDEIILTLIKIEYLLKDSSDEHAQRLKELILEFRSYLFMSPLGLYTSISKSNQDYLKSLPFELFGLIAGFATGKYTHPIPQTYPQPNPISALTKSDAAILDSLFNNPLINDESLRAEISVVKERLETEKLNLETEKQKAKNNSSAIFGFISRSQASYQKEIDLKQKKINALNTLLLKKSGPAEESNSQTILTLLETLSADKEIIDGTKVKNLFESIRHHYLTTNVQHANKHFNSSHG